MSDILAEGRRLLDAARCGDASASDLVRYEEWAWINGPALLELAEAAVAMENARKRAQIWDDEMEAIFRKMFDEPESVVYRAALSKFTEAL